MWLNMTKIVVLGAKPNDSQKKRLEALGEVKYLPSPSNSDELVKQAKWADILYSDGAFWVVEENADDWILLSEFLDICGTVMITGNVHDKE